MNKTDLWRYSNVLHRIIEEGVKWNDWKIQAHQGIFDLVDFASDCIGLSSDERRALKVPENVVECGVIVVPLS